MGIFFYITSAEQIVTLVLLDSVFVTEQHTLRDQVEKMFFYFWLQNIQVLMG